MINQNIELSMLHSAAFSNRRKVSKNRKRKLTLSRGEGIYKLSSGYIGKYKSHLEATASENNTSESSYIPELAAIILCRTQLRRGQPESALELLTKFIEKYGETKNIEVERKKVLSALERA